MPNFSASAIVPTIDRPEALKRTLNSLRSQDWLAREVIIVDASQGNDSRELIASLTGEFDVRGCRLIWQPAIAPGAASQRNQGAAAASQPVIWFFDDDILFEAQCVERLWAALQSDAKLGGVNAMIVNQKYMAPGGVSRFMFRLMAGKAETSYAGRVLGPAINLLPEDREDMPGVVSVDWLNTTCTLYRREALPDPPFPKFFTGYSMMEDVALSARVGQHWKLANARTARIYHDSQGGDHKSNTVLVARMELLNRYYVMTQVLGRRRLGDYAKLALWEAFQLVVCAINERFGREFWLTFNGKYLGVLAIVAQRLRCANP
jgi:glycosyltransferase involved in cell wall biosynthesis